MIWWSLLEYEQINWKVLKEKIDITTQSWDKSYKTIKQILNDKTPNQSYNVEDNEVELYTTKWCDNLWKWRRMVINNSPHVTLFFILPY